MNPIFSNGLVWWDEISITLRQNYIEQLTVIVKKSLMDINPAWQFVRVETPLLTPSDLVIGEYTDDVFKVTESLCLRPETTKGSYTVAKQLLEQHNKIKLPLCVWQSGKSFRNEQDKTLKNVRLKEFYQLEFQCIYSNTTAVNYKEKVIEVLKNYLKCSVEESDRLPSYSTETTDLIIDGMEIASISLRNDFSNETIVLELAFGLDRLVYQHTK